MSFQTCMSFFSYIEHKKKDILKNAVNQKLMVPIDFHSIYFPTMGVNRDQQLFGSSKFFKIFSFVFNIRK